MNEKHCLINLKKLNNEELEFGYSQVGINELFGKNSLTLELPFTRSQFIQDQPANQTGMSISGFQPKLSLRLENGSLYVANNKGTFILKPSPEAYPFLAENEHATMTVMKRLKFPTPPFGLIPFQSSLDKPKEFAFIIQRYDRLGNDVQKLHQEQLDGAMGINDKYGNVDGTKSVSYEKAAKFIIENVDDSLASKRDLFLRIIYAYVLGNNDYHLRNISILLPQNKKPSLAPIYDFVSIVPYPSVFTEYLALPLLELEENDSDIAPGLNSQYGEYTGADFILLAQGIGIRNELAKKLLLRVIKSHQLITDTYTESHLPDVDKLAIIKYISRRMTLLGIMRF
ncbi:type II toxin-antitoxin system HipA family toxin [Providencia rustigianii]|uniref:HipA-like C-terminal domain protein n=1 Tax=Providencia rustigianii DSM 4541 TaxID=500637 RepID=D1NZB2_9GAMM|nr:HipA domain-containing protein [Providencia rustigianii]EFB73810.1 HipA-like C-terminal domain protein [Providencia rustigianii DSM 4541]SUC26842.1 Uncharacterized protein related to capsule biosynthesis enzymes [Providencia rustigianii]